MDYNKIQTALDQYWEGESSLEQEALLKDYFQSAKIRQEHQAFKPLFQHLSIEQQHKIPNKKEKQSLLPFKKTKKRKPFLILNIAASLLLILCLSPYLFPEPQHPQTSRYALDFMVMKDTYTSPEQAYQETKATLMLISKKLQKGVHTTKEEFIKLKK